QLFDAGVSMGVANQDGLIVAHDPYGHRLWERRVDFGGSETALMLRYDNASADLYVVGTSATHWLILRVDAPTGAIVWQHDYFGPALQGGLPMAMALDASGGVVVGGYVDSPALRQAAVARFDSAGGLTWEWFPGIAGASVSYCPTITLDPAGDLVAKVSANVQGNSWSLHKLTSAGSLVWSRTIGSTESGLQGPLFDSASNVVYSINVSTIGGHVIAKRDSAGNLLWSVDSQAIFGINSSNYFLALAANDDILALGSSSQVARLDPNGNLLWLAGMPQSSWIDFGAFASGLAVANNGDVVARFRGHQPFNFLDLDTIARWDAAGNFLWSQAVRSFDSDVEVQTLGMALAPQGSVVISGYSQKVGSTKDMFYAAVHQASQAGCFGDGSSGPCPCGNNVPAGTASGCKTSSGIGARLDDQGIASLGSDSLRFFATGMSGSGIAILLQGQPSATPFSFQDGRMCIQAPLRRLYSASLTIPMVDFAPLGGPRVHARSAQLGDVIQPGTSRGYQLFFRGSPSQCQPGNGNLSNAIIVNWAP
ncbi:MAG TPA: PQQ-binding-like beta-propeller repeat protein, partial [Planctomycetota bacterium]|nr:PQQ-binding-like beta-propeller repeat protein [Planctomycetota bacterium]